MSAVTLLPPPSNAPPAQAAKLWKAARDFEAMTVGQLLQPMFDSVDTANSAFGGGQAEDAWKPMLVQAIGQGIEARGGLGLAVPVFYALLHAQERRAP